MFDRAGSPLYAVGPREPGLPDAAVSRATAAFAGRELFATDRDKAAALVHGINSSHVFRDGNKRTTVAALAVVLDRNDWTLACSDDELFEFIVAVADSARPPYNGPTEDALREIASWIRSHTIKRERVFGDTDVMDFLHQCESAGGSFRRSGQSWIVWGLDGQRSVKISLSTSHLAPGVVKSYLSRIGLSEPWTGLDRHEFRHGTREDQQLIQRFRGVLDRLAAYDSEPG